MAPLRAGTVPTTSDEFICVPELDRLATYCGPTRLITVIGAGGLGKTVWSPGPCTGCTDRAGARALGAPGPLGGE